MNPTAIKQAAELLHGARKAVAFTGAGVSTESGIPDFRSRAGLWSRFDPMEYGTISAFRREPQKVWRMLQELLGIAEAVPNSGHKAMARLEEMGVLKGIITQNIDMLHQKAGSRAVVEFHGSIATFSCLSCGAAFPLAVVQQGEMPPTCSFCGAILKPDVVLFDERIPPQALSDTEHLLAGVDVLLVAGTSCEVAPASMLPATVHAQGGRIIEINLSPALGPMASVTLAGSFASIMDALVREIAPY